MIINTYNIKGDTMSMIGTMASLVKVLDKLRGTSNYDQSIGSLGLSNSNIELLKSDGNMVNLLSKFVINPVIFVSEDAYNRTDIDAILQHTTDVYASFYLQVFRILVNIHGLTTQEALSVLSTTSLDVEEWTGLEDASIIDAESLDSESFFPQLDIDLEATRITKTREIKGIERDDLVESKTIVRTVEIVINTKGTAVTTVPGMAKPKTDTVDSTATIPLTIKASVLVYPAKTIVNSVKFRGNDSSLFSRLIKWKIGLISATNLLTGNDLAEEYKKGTLSKDNFSKVLNDATKNQISLNTLLDKNVNVNKTVFTYIVTDDEANMISKEIGYKLKGRDLDKALNTLLAFNLVTINEDRDMITSYINGISGGSVSSINKLVKASKGSGADSIELIASAMLANRPY